MRRHLVGINTHHQIGDVIVDLREPVPCAGRNDDHVSSLELIAHTIANRRTVVAWPIEQTHGFFRRRTALHVEDIGTQHQRARPVDDVIDFTDQIVLGDRVRRRYVQLSAIHNANSRR